MKAVVLAGGEGNRLKPLTYKRPKPLMPVAGRPCIDYVLQALASSGFHEIVVTTAYMSDALIKSIGDGLGYNASILYSFEENPAGTAGAVRRVGNFFDESFVVSMGDILCDVDFKALYDFHKRKGAAVTIALTEVEDPTQYGVVGLDSNGRIAKFKEKPKKEEAFSNLVNAGIYVLEPEVLEFVPPDQKFDFAKDLFPKLMSKGLGLYGSRIEGVWMDIGQPHDLWKASVAIVTRQGKPLRLPGVISEGPVILDPTAHVEDGVRIGGPSYIGPAVLLKKGSVIDNSCLHEGARVESNATIEKSLVLEGSTIGSSAQVVDSVVSRDCVIGEGARIVSSIIGEGMTVRAGSKLENATVSLPPR
ncbi:MAG: NDP-sugar synthase [Methanobacteriota archaeon]|nr:MAG: NDP-sugar synthase [Euryarchaeota archaeon]